MKPQPLWDIVVVGGINTDYLIRGPRLPAPGETLAGDEFMESPGGKGANQAVAARRLGARVAFIGRIGNDQRGQALLEHLQTEGVDTRHLQRDASVPTGVALVQVGQHGQKSILAARLANGRLAPDDIVAARETIQASQLLLTQLEAPLPAVQAAIALAREASVRVFLDPSPPGAVPDSLLAQVDLIKPNAAEARALTGIEVADIEAARVAARQLLERGVGAVVIDLPAADGNLAVWPDGERWVPRIPVASVDATGAGDAFIATLAVLSAEGHSLAEAAPLASAAAALATLKLGAQASLPRRQEVHDLLRRMNLDQQCQTVDWTTPIGEYPRSS